MAHRSLPALCSRSLGGALVAVATWVGAYGAAQSPQGKIPDELAVIAAACRENSARIQTLQLSGTFVATGGHHEGQWDPFTGETYNSQTRQFSLWKDALNCRLDVTADREVSPENEVNYNLPYGEHITSYAKLEREGGVDALKRRYGTPQSTRRTIVTPDNTYRYKPELNQVELNDPFTARELDEQPEPELQFALNKTLMGFTVAECVDRWAELAQRGDRSLEVTLLEGGQYRIRSTVTVQRTGGPPQCYTHDMVVDLEKGGNVLSYVRQTDGETVETGQFDYMNADGAWVVAHAEIASRVAPGVPAANGVYDVQAESVRINEPIDPQLFTFEGLAVRSGALVFDAETREEYLYDDVPLDVKVALAMEREREENLVEAEARAAASPPPGPADEPARGPRQSDPSKVPVSMEPAGRTSEQPENVVVLTPTSQLAATQPATAPSRKSPHTRVVATQPAPKVTADRDTATAPDRGRTVPSTTTTAVVVSIACIAALGIGIWRLARRGKPHAS